MMTVGRGLIPIGRSAMTKIAVMIVDDCPTVTHGLRSILKFQADMEVVGDAAGGDEAITIARKLQPTVILLDADIPGCDCIETARSLKISLPTTKIIFMAVHPSHIDSAIEAGADRLLMKDAPRQELIETIRELAVEDG